MSVSGGSEEGASGGSSGGGVGYVGGPLRVEKGLLMCGVLNEAFGRLGLPFRAVVGGELRVVGTVRLHVHSDDFLLFATVVDDDRVPIKLVGKDGGEVPYEYRLAGGGGGDEVIIPELARRVARESGESLIKLYLKVGGGEYLITVRKLETVNVFKYELVGAERVGGGK